ncbi:MAG: thiamine phosphate synthase [Proteobacteria bacterium]|nr:thiamine phosphate synthase [Pseudomonadota bacterium]MBU1715434.1 thiamine phosphate synthase [Pseudomonadota bacterium]
MITEQAGLYRLRMNKFKHEVTIYPVSCEKLAKGRSDIDWLQAVLAGGAKIVQLRDKESDDRTLFEKAAIFRRETTRAGALFIVNNRLDIALLTGADGIHLGNSDIPAQEARRLAPDLIIGVSANTEEQAATAASRGASYFNIGPLFPTNTKENLTTFLGPEAIKKFSALSPLPFTVMGGIKLEHVPELTDQGAQRIAVVTALTMADDITLATERWTVAISTGLKGKDHPSSPQDH